MAVTKTGALSGALDISDASQAAPNVAIRLDGSIGDVDAAVEGALALDSASTAWVTIYNASSYNLGSDVAAHVVRLESRDAVTKALRTCQVLLDQDHTTAVAGAYMDFNFTDLVIICGNADANIQKIQVNPNGAGGNAIELKWAIAGL